MPKFVAVYLGTTEGIVLLMMVISIFEKTWSKISFLRRWGGPYVVPFNAHWGFWSDIFFLSPLFTYIVYRYSKEWSAPGIMGWGVVAAALSWKMLKQWERGSIVVKDSCTRSGESYTNAYLHVAYMIIIITTILLFYFNTRQVSADMSLLVTGALIAHLAIGTLQPRWYVFKSFDPDTLMVFGVGTGLVWLACLFQLFMRKS